MKSILFVASFLFSTSCATMFNSGSQTIQARSSQGSEGVAVDVIGSSGSYSAKLPVTIVESPSTFSHLEIKVNDPCYNETRSRVSRGVTPSYWANIFNIWGFFIDPFTGAMWKYDNNVALITEKNGKCK